MGWETSTRRDTLPPNWPAIVAATRERAGGQCEWTNDGNRCQAQGAECDHKGHRLDHNDTQWLCKKHHTQKTQREAQAARAKQQAKLRHPANSHAAPGMLTD